MRHWRLSLVVVLYVFTFDAHHAPAGAASSNILTTPQKAAPQLQKPQPNPNVLKATPAMMKTPGFEIGFLIPSRAGFQPCTAPAGYLGSGKDGPDGGTGYLSDLYCAKGNVTVTQTNPLVKLSGQKLRLAVTIVSAVVTWFGSASYETDWYELPSQNQNSVAFQIILGNGVNTQKGLNNLDDKTYLVQAFQNGTPLKIDAQYNGESYASLNCTFKSYPVTTTAPIGSNDPAPDTINCP